MSCRWLGNNRLLRCMLRGGDLGSQNGLCLEWICFNMHPIAVTVESLQCIPFSFNAMNKILNF